MRQNRHFVAPDRMVSTGAERDVVERRKPAIIWRTILVGFALATAFGIYLGSLFGWVTGIIAGWIGGNALALGLAYLWFRIDRAREARAARAFRDDDDDFSDSSPGGVA